MRTWFKKGELWTVLFLVIAMGFIYRDVLIGKKILFPSNFLAAFYSPWSTVTFDGYPNGVPNKPIGGNDQVRMFYPYRTFINESFSRRQFPLWNPYNFSGGPILANFQSAVFYPLNLIYLVLPQLTAWSILVVAQPLLATLFMYFYLRQFIARKLAAFFGAFAFGFCGFILAWSQENAVVGQAALWFPLILLTTDAFLTRPSRKFFLALVIALACCIFSGHLQTIFYIFLVSFLYGITRFFRRRHQHKVWVLPSFFFAFILSLLFCAIQLLPSLEAFSESPRSSSFAEPFLETYLMPFTHFINAIDPDIFGNPGSYNYFGRGFYQESVFYIGVIPLIFALIAFRRQRKNEVVSFFLWVAAVSFFLGIDSPFTRWFFRLPILLVNTFSPSRIFFVTSAALSIVSAYGFSYWLENGSKDVRKIVFTASAAMGVAVIVFSSFIYISVLTKNKTLADINSYLIRHHIDLRETDAKVSLKNIVPSLAMLAVIFLVFSVPHKFKYSSILVVGVLCLGQFYFMNKYMAVGSPEFLYPNHFIFDDLEKTQRPGERFLSFGLPILGNVALHRHAYSPDGIDPVFSARYGQLLLASKKDGTFSTEIPRIEANLSEYADNENLVNNTRRQRLSQLLGVTRVYNYEANYRNKEDIAKIFSPDQYVSVWEKDNWRAYVHAAALPRAFFADEYVIETNPQKSINLLFDQNFNLKKSLVLEEIPVGFEPTAKPRPGEVAITKYTPHRIEMNVSTETDRLLFLSDTYYPGWHASVDKKPAKIYRADYAFRAIVVPKGSKFVEFDFKSDSFRLGAVISSTVGIMLLFIMLIPARKFFPHKV
jgi:hypothetical protein